MASSWGVSFGTAWGNVWGGIAVTPTQFIPSHLFTRDRVQEAATVQKTAKMAKEPPKIYTSGTRPFSAKPVRKRTTKQYR